jgi:uncharacterized protein DUF4397
VTTHRHIAALVLGAAAIAACGTTAQTDITAPAPSAKVLFLNEGLNSPGVNFFADSTKLTAISSATGLQTPVGTTYSQVAAGGYYTGLAAGAHTLSGRLSDTTAANHNVVISSVSTTLADGKWYSYYQSGLYDATGKKVDAFVVEDPIPTTIDYTVANVRFVNAIYNANPGTLTVTNADTSVHPTPPPAVIGGAVAYKTAGAYVAVPAGSYSLSVAGLGATPLTHAAVALAGGRYYTITARGDMTVTSSTATNRPTLDNQPNR